MSSGFHGGRPGFRVMTWRTRRSALHRTKPLLSAGGLQAPHEDIAGGCLRAAVSLESAPAARCPQGLSGGQCQPVSLARALAR